MDRPTEDLLARIRASLGTTAMEYQEFDRDVRRLCDLYVSTEFECRMFGSALEQRRDWLRAEAERADANVPTAAMLRNQAESIDRALNEHAT